MSHDNHAFQQTKSRNLLLHTSAPLITLITIIKRSSEQNQVAALRAQVIEEIKNLEHQLQKASYPLRLILAVRYSLCTVIDEAVLSREWGSQSIWVEQSLLSLFHQETWGGERFYIILEEMVKDPKENLEFLEFIYTLLSLGFEGKFFGKNLAIRDEIRSKLYYRIRLNQEKKDKILLMQYSDIEWTDDRNNKKEKLKKLAVTCLIAVVLFSVYYNLKTYHAAVTIIHELDDIATVSPITEFSQDIQRSLIIRGRKL